MRNISFKLPDLFKEYLKRKEKERYTVAYSTYPSYSGYRTTSYLGERTYEGVIYFYEWSDVDRVPMLFYNVNSFDGFLRRSDIFMSPFHKDVIYQLDRAYVACRKGTHDIVIRGTKEMLEEALKRSDCRAVDNKTLDIAMPPGNHVGVTNPNYRPECLKPVSKPPMYCGAGENWYG